MSALDLARAAIDVAVAGGVREVVLCPGSRSAPLAYAVLAAERAGHLRLHVRVDERSAGFLALGLAKVSRAPALVITTSGTAVANLHPAVLEAHHGSVPLIVLSADRPAALRGSGANQTTIQPGIFAIALRWEADLDADGDAREIGPPIEAAIAAAVGEAASSAEPPRPGPAHINLCLREPLVPVTWPPVDDWPLNGRQSAPREGVGGRELRGVDPVFPAAEVFVDDVPRTLLIVGDLVDPSTRPAVVRWAAARGLPVVAEPFGDHAGDKAPGGDHGDDLPGSDHADDKALGGDHGDDRPGSDHGDDRPGSGQVSAKALGGDHADDRPGSGHVSAKALGGNHGDNRPGSDHAGDTAPVAHALVPGTRSNEPGVLPHGPLVLTDADWLDAHAPDRVLVAGRVTLARAVMALLRRPGVRVDALTDTPVAPDPAQVVRASFPLAAILSPGRATDGPHVSQPAPAPSTTSQSTSPLPTPAQPAPEPVTSQPATAEPTPAQPTTNQPTPAQPTTNQPTPAQPATNQPTPAKPTTDQPTSTPGQPAALATPGAGDRRTWAAAWQAAGDRLIAAIEAEPPQWPTGLAVAQTLVAALGTRPGPTHLFVGPSNPVRDLDLGVAEYPPHLTVVASRGLAGIDGCVSTAVGIALTVGSAYALMGDLTFLHDANGLLIGPHEVRPDLTIVVVNDAGGGIFRLLEPGTEPLAEAFDRLFGTPTATDIAALCRAHGVAYARADTPADLTRLVTTAPDGLRVVEVPIDPRTHRAAHARLRAQAAAAQAGSTPVAGDRSVRQ